MSEPMPWDQVIETLAEKLEMMIAEGSEDAMVTVGVVSASGESMRLLLMREETYVTYQKRVGAVVDPRSHGVLRED